tara:strand:+ start:2623 stop:2790 length:168 start_codon:yes stop_codon:yes gene_type:complete
MKRYKLELINYDLNNNPVSGVSRVIEKMSFKKLRKFQNDYPGREDLVRKLNIKEI